MSNNLNYKIIEEIVEKQLSKTGKINYLYFVIIETKYGICKLRKEQFKKNKKVTRQCAINPTEFLQNESNEKHNSQFVILGQYTKNDELIEILHRECNSIFKQAPSTHIRVKGCPICSGKQPKTFEEIVEISNKLHNNFYTYIKVDKTTSNSNLKIICPVHDLFKQKIKLHLRGNGCPKCGRNMGWTKSSFISKCNKNNNGLGIFYIIRCFNETEEFYKFGVTSLSIKRRYNTKSLMPYQYEIIQEIYDQGSVIYDFEKHFKRQIFKMDKNINPKILFPGSSTECFKL